MTDVRRSVVPTRVGPVPVRAFGPSDSGPVVLCVHGALVDGRVWDGVAARLAERATVLLPDLPLGAHQQAVPDRSRLTPPDLAGALVDLLDGLGVTAPVVVVGNDSGGALTQVAVAGHPDRFAGLVLTSCDAFKHFPPPLLRPFPWLVRVPGGTRAVARLFSLPALLSRPGPFNLLTARPVDEALVRSMMRPVLTDDGVRDDLTAFVSSMDKVHTLRAAEVLARWAKPAVIAWSRRDRIFPPRDGERLAATLPGAELFWIEDALTFSMLDQPEAVAAAVGRVLDQIGVGAAQG